MNGGISRGLRTTFLVHFVVAGIFGLALFLVPGRSLSFVGWVPEIVELTRQAELAVPGTFFVDPILSRILGAAILALAYSSFRGWRAQDWSAVAPVVKVHFVFCILGVIAIVGGMVATTRTMPLAVWVGLVILIGFAIAWGLALQRQAFTS